MPTLPTPFPALALAIAESLGRLQLAEGERYIGPVLDDTGALAHHLILLPGQAEGLTFDQAVAWATAAGGTLPSRQEQSLLLANAKAQFEPKWYWSGETYEDDGSCAWYLGFSDGYQFNTYESWKGRARAVRRFKA